MNPCEICGDRILHYPGICDPCKEQRRRTAETQWMPAYEFVTEARDKGNKSTFNAKGNTDHTAAGRPATDKQIAYIRLLETKTGADHQPPPTNASEAQNRISGLRAAISAPGLNQATAPDHSFYRT